MQLTARIGKLPVAPIRGVAIKSRPTAISGCDEMEQMLDELMNTRSIVYNAFALQWPRIAFVRATLVGLSAAACEGWLLNEWPHQRVFAERQR